MGADPDEGLSAKPSYATCSLSTPPAPFAGLSAKPLPSAAIKNRVEVLKLLLEAGADPNGAETDGSTALLKAVAMRHTQPSP